MREGKETSSMTTPLRRKTSSSSTIAASTHSTRTSNDEPSSGISIFSRSPTNSTCTSIANSSLTKDEEAISPRFSLAQWTFQSQPQVPQQRRMRSPFRRATSPLPPSASRAKESESMQRPNLLSPTSMPTELRRSKSMDRSANRNVHTDCGRHSNDWLFGGFSVTGSIKKMIEKKDNKK